MRVVHPAITAAITALMPTVPVPNTAMLLPAGGRRALSTAPAPVWIPHPSGPRSSSGAAGSILTTFRSVASAWVAKDDWPKNAPWMAASPLRNVVLPSGRVPAKL